MHSVRVSKPRLKWVLLYPTHREWRHSVGEVPEAIGCGALDDIPPNASFEEARTALLRILNSGEWVAPGPLLWKKTDEMDGWSASVEGER